MDFFSTPQLTYSFILRWNIDYKEAKIITRNTFANYSNAMPEFAEVWQMEAVAGLLMGRGCSGWFVDGQGMHGPMIE